MSANRFIKDIPAKATYVYGLLNEDYVFYIGITAYIEFRYKQHFSDLHCANYIRAMKVKGKEPKIIIYGAFQTIAEAYAAEHCLIRNFYLMGNKLCNNDQNPYDNQIHIDFIKDVPKSKPKEYRKMIDNAINDYKIFRKWKEIK